MLITVTALAQSCGDDSEPAASPTPAANEGATATHPQPTVHPDLAEPTLDPCGRDGPLPDYVTPRETWTPIDCVCAQFQIDPYTAEYVAETPPPPEAMVIESPQHGDEFRGSLRFAATINSIDGWYHVQVPGFGSGSYRIESAGAPSTIDMEFPFEIEEPTVACVRVANAADYTLTSTVANIGVYLVPGD